MICKKCIFKLYLSFLTTFFNQFLRKPTYGTFLQIGKFWFTVCESQNVQEGFVSTKIPCFSLKIGTFKEILSVWHSGVQIRQNWSISVDFT